MPFPSLPPIPLLTDVTINDHLLRLSLFLSPLCIPSLPSASPFPHFFLPLNYSSSSLPSLLFAQGLVWVEFNAPPDTTEVISEAVFRANHLTDTDKQNSTGKYKQTQYKSEKADNLKYSKTKLPWYTIASYNTRPGNEVGLLYNAPEPTRGFCFPINPAKFLVKTCPCDTFDTFWGVGKNNGITPQVFGCGGDHCYHPAWSGCLCCTQWVMV